MSVNMNKSYLAEQIWLLTLNGSDFFTDDELALCQQIQDCRAQLEEAMDEDILTAKKGKQAELDALILKHAGIPRVVNPKCVLTQQALQSGKTALSWYDMKLSRRIAEFCSEESRVLGLEHKDITYDKIIIKWKYINILEQLVKDGFYADVVQPNGSIARRKYIIHTASAGQLRTSKVQALDEETYNRVRMTLECGLTEEAINAKGGMNYNKLMAYRALASSATTAWLRQDGTPVSPRSAVVVSDFESQITGMMDYIKPDYTIERGMRTVVINQCDGCGMALPTLITGNLMVRLPWVKGLVTPFDFIAWCNEHNCPAVVTDYWGKTHDLAAENIEIIFTESQFKMAKYYESWEDYCNKFEQYSCCARATNFEEEWIEDSQMNYQFLQTLTEMTDDEVSAFTAKARNRIQSVTSTQNGMLDILGCNKRVLLPYQQALKMYPPLLRLNQFRSNIAAMKKRMVLDARSGAIKCRNKRLFVVPDIYAWCERLFLGIENPVGLLKNGEVAANIFKGKRIACLRSPHLFIEWALRDCVDNPEVYKWFTSNAVYISIHDMITRIVMCDCDGDELNCIDEPNLLAAAERTLKKWDVVPLFYDAIKAKAEFVDRDAMFRGLKRAYDFGNIGTISNSLTRLWNKPNPDVYAAKCVCKLNNFVIKS